MHDPVGAQVAPINQFAYNVDIDRYLKYRNI